MFANTTRCIRFAMKGCSVKQGVVCAPGTYLNVSSDICIVSRPAVSASPCTDHSECAEGHYCKQYLGTKRAIQSECAPAATIGEICGVNGLPCQGGVCFNSVCRKYVSNGGRCDSGSYAQCDPLTSSCNLGKCVYDMSLRDGADCNNGYACKSGVCSAGHCIPYDVHTCVTNADCHFSMAPAYQGPGSGISAVCREGKCFYPRPKKIAALAKCLHNVYSGKTATTDVRGRLIEKCGKQYAEALCANACLQPEDRRIPMETFYGLNLEGMTIDCAAKTVSMISPPNCDLTPAAVYQNCDAVKSW